MCNGIITDGVCECYTHNCYNGVRGDAIDVECPHKVWVDCYRAVYNRTMRTVSLEVVEQFEGGE